MSLQYSWELEANENAEFSIYHWKKESRNLLWDFDLMSGDYNKRMNSSDNSVPVLYINQHQPPSLKHHYTVRICPWWEVVILVFMSADKNGSWGERMYCWADLLSTGTVFIIDPTLVIQTIPASCLVCPFLHPHLWHRKRFCNIT